jgi:hypothetical protein
MKKLLVLAFILLTTNAIADEKTTVSDFTNALVEQKNKLITHFSNEKADTIAFQKKSWEDGKIQLAKNIEQIKSLFKWNKNATQD